MPSYTIAIPYKVLKSDTGNVLAELIATGMHVVCVDVTEPNQLATTLLEICQGLANDTHAKYASSRTFVEFGTPSVTGHG